VTAGWAQWHVLPLFFELMVQIPRSSSRTWCIQVLPTQLIPGDNEGKVLRVKHDPEGGREPL